MPCNRCTKYGVRACGETAAVKSQCREGVVWFDGTCLCLIHKATIYGAVSSVRSMYGVGHAKTKLGAFNIHSISRERAGRWRTEVDQAKRLGRTANDVWSMSSGCAVGGLCAGWAGLGSTGWLVGGWACFVPWWSKAPRPVLVDASTSVPDNHTERDRPSFFGWWWSEAGKGNGSSSLVKASRVQSSPVNHPSIHPLSLPLATRNPHPEKPHGASRPATRCDCFLRVCIHPFCRRDHRPSSL